MNVCTHFFLAVLLVSTLLTGQARAMQVPVKERVTIVVLDQSGSMRLDLNQRKPPTKASDPQGLRCSAVRLLADLATTRDSLGLVKLESHDDKTDSTADRTAEILLPPLAMGTDQARITFKNKIDCDHATYNTPIADSLKKAYELLETVERQRGLQSFEGRVLLLTDGEPAPMGSTQIDEINGLLPQFAAKQWSVSTVGLKLRANKLQRAILLLERVATRTGGKSFGDVDEPLELQNIFLEFFAQQVGRSLQRGNPETLQPNGEHTIQVADYAQHIDILVAKDNPDARITLQRPDFTEVTANATGLELFSNDDRFYAAFSIDAPVAGAWSIHTDRPTSVIVNVLVASDLKIRLEQTQQVRPSNQPLLLEARFYSTSLDGQAMPAAVHNAEVTARVELLGQPYTVQLHDNGNPPDRAANDGLYTAALTPASLENEDNRVSANIELTGKTGDAVFTDHATLPLVALPSATFVETDGTLRLAPGTPIEVPLQLQVGRHVVSPEGWMVRVRQKVGDETRTLDAPRRGDYFVVTLEQLAEDQREYVFDVDVVGVEQNAGLERLGQALSMQVIFQPTLKLYFDPPRSLPVNQPIQLSAALLKSYNTTTPITTPLRVNVQRNDDPAQPIQQVEGDGKGYFTYTYIPERPGRYRFTLLPPPDQLLAPITKEVSVEAIPEVRWEKTLVSGTALTLHPTSWAWLDLWRKVPLVGPITALPLRRFQSEQVVLRGDILRDSQPYTGTVVLSLLGPNGTTVLTETVTTSSFGTAWDVPPGSYQLQALMDHVFAPGIACCQSEIPLTIEQVQPPLGQTILAAGTLGTEALLLLLMFLTSRWFFSPRPRHGDKLMVTIKGTPRPINLKTEQKWGFLRPRDIDLTAAFRQRGADWPKQGRVRFLAESIEYNGQSIPTKSAKSKEVIPPKQVDGHFVLFERGRSHPAENSSGPGSRGPKPTIQPTPRPRPKSQRSIGLLATLLGLFGRVNKQSQQRRSKDQRAASQTLRPPHKPK